MFKELNDFIRDTTLRIIIYKNKINIYFDSIVIKTKGIKNKTKISKDFVLLYFGDKKE